jgi:intracellular sulfur oxidation DsrE/DsrF family protein
MKQTYNTVFHLDREEKLPLQITLGNIRNLFKEIENGQAIILANFKAPALFLKGSIEKEIYELLKSVKNKNVKIYICENSLKMLNITKNELIEECDFVQAGIKTLIELQNEGFAYIKP